MLDKTELESMIEHEKRQTALEYQHEAWADGISDGIDLEIMAEAAIATAITELVEKAGEDAVLDYLDRLKAQVLAGEFMDKTLQ